MTISSLLTARLRQALAGMAEIADIAKIAELVPQVTAAGDARFGDYQTNVAMILAKQTRANPRQLAQKIIEQLDVADCCAPPEIAGAGFINFRLAPAWLAERFAALVDDPRLGVPAPTQVKKIVIDFSGPNVAKPMHVGHIRSTILGAALARIATFCGHEVVRDNHLGDWGTQFGMLLVGWKTKLDRAALEDDPISELERVYKAVNAQRAEERAANSSPGNTPTEEAISLELIKLQNGDEENLGLWREMIRLSQKQFDEIYRRLGVEFDVTLGESFYNPQLKDIVRELCERGLAQESNGAWCVFSEGLSAPADDPFLVKDQNGWRANPALIQKSDGAANYATTDLATLAYREATWAPDEIVYVTDGRQQLHFRQLFAIYRRWRPEVPVQLAHAWFGSILGDDGKPFKTRSGETIRLADLLDEAAQRAFVLVSEKNPTLSEHERLEIARIVGLGAVKYADLLPNRQSDYVFSWAKMLSFQGNTAPYLQYSCVRIRSIFRKAEAAGIGAPSGRIAFTEPAELALAKKLFQFGEVLPQVLEDYRPNLLANYLYELAATFHSFFESCPVLTARDEIQTTRLLLCTGASRVLSTGLKLLGIEIPERM